MEAKGFWPRSLWSMLMCLFSGVGPIRLETSSIMSNEWIKKESNGLCIGSAMPATFGKLKEGLSDL
jgi:hypothetical protein